MMSLTQEIQLKSTVFL